MIGFRPDELTADEATSCAARFSRAPGPVVVVRNLPADVVRAMLARYSQSGESIRRVFLDEFAPRLADRGVLDGPRGAGQPVTVALEQISLLAAQRVRTLLDLPWVTSSPALTAYDSRVTGRFRYVRDDELIASRHGAVFVGSIDVMFDAYRELSLTVGDHLRRHDTHTSGDELTRRRRLRAATFAAVRPVLPLGAQTQMAATASTDALRIVALRLRADALAEVAGLGLQLDAELDDALGENGTLAGVHGWRDMVELRRRSMAALMHDFILDDRSAPDTAAGGEGADIAASEMRLVHFDPRSEANMLTAMCMPYSTATVEHTAAVVDTMTSDERDAVVRAYLGPSAWPEGVAVAALASLMFTFEVVGDVVGGWDLSASGWGTVTCDRAKPRWGYGVPEPVTAAGAAAIFDDAMQESARLYARLEATWDIRADYALASGFRAPALWSVSATDLAHGLRTETNPVLRCHLEAAVDALAHTPGLRRVASALVQVAGLSTR